MRNIILSILVTLSLLTVVGCNTKQASPVNVNSQINLDEEYSKVIGLINDEKWEDASLSVEVVKEYKDGEILKKFLVAYMKYEKISNGESDLSAYKTVIDDIAAIPDDYQGVLKEKINDWKSKVKANFIQAELNEIANLINQKDYKSAKAIINNSKYDKEDSTYSVLYNYITAFQTKDANPQFSRDMILTIPENYNGLLSKEIKLETDRFYEQLVTHIKDNSSNKMWNFASDTLKKNKTVRALYDYHFALTTKCSSYEKNDCMISYLANIDDDYDGLLSSEIKPLQKKYAKEIQDNRADKARIASLPTPVQPTIGMTAEQVEKSTWGKPSRTNKTTTKYGTSEQWVYERMGYIYFEDGKVTAIQTSSK
ncbi:hypothetical protein [Paenibacillus oryzisoli]|uniref:Lipoprotein n=1 Tax=Paenibacillus oryzisoli TaxID=1850517 RepID=A0A198ACW2_9BACL|nr:hypothetical protein [Paenibacillus oryzisoli]OAS18906.1 hypothetical protein A8708_32160 [Paenibacillus oryzisoli]